MVEHNSGAGNTAIGPLWLKLCAALVLGFSLLTASQAQELAPAVEDVSLTVTRGSSVKVRLSASTTSIRRIEFVLLGKKKDRLKHGTLTEPKTGKSKKEAIVVYTPNLEGPDATEVFTYLARQLSANPEGGKLTSVNSGTVRIRIRAAHPDLIAEESVDFGELFVGEAATRELRISNKGGATYRGAVKLPPGFSSPLIKDGELELGPKTTLRLPLIFKPTTTGRVHDSIVISSQASATIRSAVYGTATPPFVATPINLKFAWDPVAEARTATLRVDNATGSQLRLAVATPPELELPGRITISPRGNQEWTLTIPATKRLSRLESKVTFQVEEFAQSVPLLAETVPGYLRVQEGPPVGSVLHFADGIASQGVKITIANVGGATESVFPTTTRNFSVTGLKSGQELAVGESVTVRVHLTKSVPTNRTGKFSLRCGVQILRFNLLATTPKKEGNEEDDSTEIVEADESTKLLAGPCIEELAGGDAIMMADTLGRMKMAKADLQKTLYYERGGVLKDARYEWVDNIPRIERIVFDGGGKSHLHFSWPTLKGGPYQYKIYQQTMQVDIESGRISKVWEPTKNYEIETKDGKTQVRMRELRPSSAYHYRVIVVGKNNRASLPSPVFSFVTAVPPSPMFLVLVGVGGLVALSIGIVIYRRVKRRKFYRRLY
jgi:hypothetical protein